MANLEAERELAERKYKAAKAVTKWLADFSPEEKLQVLQHVAVELRLAVTPLPVEPSKGPPAHPTASK